MLEKLIQNKHLQWLPFIFGILLYSNTLKNEYALDDFAVILDHDYVTQGLNGIDEIFTTNLLHGVQQFNDGLYRPIAPMTFALEFEFFKDNPYISHFINIIIFGFVVFLLFRLLRRLFGTNGQYIALFATLLFAAHPIHTEVVANIKSRDELFASLFLLWSTNQWLNYLDLKKNTYLFGAITLYILALFSKESAITYFAAIPTFLWLKKDISIKQLMLPAGIMLALSAAFYGWHSHIISSMPNPVSEGLSDLLNNAAAHTQSLSERYGTAFYLQILYLQKLVFPNVLLHDYSYNLIPVVSLSSWQGVIGLLFFVFLVVFGIIGFFKKNKIATLVIFYLLSIAVVSQLFITIGALFAERFLFVPSIAFCVIIAILLQQLFQFKKYLSFLLFIPVLALLSAKTIARNSDWKNNSTLYAADIQNGIKSARINYNYGSVLTQQANEVKDKTTKQHLYSQSTKYLQNAVEIYPQYWDAYNNLALAYKYNGQFELSEKVFLLLLKKDPSYNKAYFNLATVQLELEKGEEALNNLIIFTNNTPTVDAFSMMGTISGALGDFHSAKTYFRKVLEMDPNNENAYNYIGTAEGFLGQPLAAIENYKKALQINPNNVETYYNIAISYSQIGDTTNEIMTLNTIQKIRPGIPEVVNRLNELNRSR
ncbi:tetratricopeptide repeat protein [Acidiluteibacter ferrifornacis]|uniref:dolichyl-phosphate-mannose--protein mannosyltransferase n=1 Tax=Acidiluteibacter ferrifornacis TaxID=2692424 RepID=A0A6N9NLG9_9FLAO|nr:tetratricopeptide repeat protein [Acidiluteibacter ferrifornacis]NBG65977.1 tetratricopeptide repeat protein [Acidiluteibacter ferrifornacis]